MKLFISLLVVSIAAIVYGVTHPEKQKSYMVFWRESNSINNDGSGNTRHNGVKISDYEYQFSDTFYDRIHYTHLTIVEQ